MRGFISWAVNDALTLEKSALETLYRIEINNSGYKTKLSCNTPPHWRSTPPSADAAPPSLTQHPPPHWRSIPHPTDAAPPSTDAAPPSPQKKHFNWVTQDQDHHNSAANQD